MSDRSVRVPEATTGADVDAELLLVGGAPVVRQRVVVADPVDADGTCRVLSREPRADEKGTVSRLLFPAGMSGAFGPLLSVPLTPILALAFPYGLTDYMKSEGLNGGTVTAADGKALLQTSTAANGEASLRSREALRYVPGQGVTVFFTCLFGAGAANSQQEIGIGDKVDGFFFARVGATFGVIRRRDGVDDFIPQASWDDPCDGTGASGINLDPSLGHPFGIRYQWLGYGAIKFLCEHPATGQLFVVHTIKYAGTSVDQSVFNPTLPLWARVLNSGNASNIAMQTPSMGAYVEGPRYNGGLHRAARASRTGVSSIKPILSIRNATTINGVPNRANLRITGLTVGSQSGAQDCDFTVKVGATLTAPSFADWATGRSIAEVDTAATGVSGGDDVFMANVDGGTTVNLSLREQDIVLAPGETLTVTSASGGNGNPRCSLNWVEEL